MPLNTATVRHLSSGRVLPKAARRLVQLRSRGRLVVPKDCRQTLTWLRQDAAEVVLDHVNRGRILVATKDAFTEGLMRARESILNADPPDNLDEYSMAIDEWREMALLGLEMRFTESHIDRSGRMSLEIESISHLGVGLDETEEIYVIRLSDHLELWSQEFYWDFYRRFAEPVKLDTNSSQSSLPLPLTEQTKRAN